ncbi:MAG: hypothetical protein WC455_14280 [Dehalococcoidia bacterium]
MLLTTSKHCARCGRVTQATLVRTIVSNGTSQVWWKCEAGHAIDNPRKNIAHEKIVAYGVSIESIPVEKTYSVELCEVCGRPGVEVHHWAPRHLFGDECDSWPKSNLCKACHAKWHALVTPNMSKRNADGYRKVSDQSVRVGSQNTAR